VLTATNDEKPSSGKRAIVKNSGALKIEAATIAVAHKSELINDTVEP
jgi:hypothetical protein